MSTTCQPIFKTTSTEETADPIKETIIELENLEEQANNGIREFLRSKNPYEFQDLVAALLKAMGLSLLAPTHPTPKTRQPTRANSSA